MNETDVLSTTDVLLKFGLTILLLGLLGALLWFAHVRTKRYFARLPHREFNRQLIMLGLTTLAVFVAILAAPIGLDLKKEVLGIFGIILSATIALSSTTLMGNAMAGIMLRVVRNFSPGDYIYVGDHRGRVAEMDLLHIEIQTEDRDLTTLPNLYVVTTPVRVLRKSGTLLAAEVSLGYDVPRQQVEELLVEAARQTGLEKPVLQIRSLGDYSVSYAIAGLLTDTYHLLKKRRELRARTLDALHRAGVEIASPALLSIRDYPATKAFVSETSAEPDPEDTSGNGPDATIFDKALQAQTVTRLRERVQRRAARVAEIDAQLKGEITDAERESLTAEKDTVNSEIERLTKVAEEREARIEQS